MRDIKYKAWDIKNNTFSEDFVLAQDNGKLIAYTNDSEMRKLQLIEYTGLLDKSGKEIYEGDIVDYKGIKDVVKWQEYWDDVESSFAGYSFRCINPKYLEVVGNVHEHPELLTP